MKTAEFPENEAERLSVLESYRILDTEPEASYDDITRLAAMMCDVPIALISLVDAKRQWFKSKVGLSAKETPREQAFCAHAILGKDIFLVPDARLDKRFQDNPLVKGGLFLVFYAGVPLITPTGEALGTLCIIDKKPRDLGPAQIEGLSALARQVTSQLELRKQNYQITEQLQELRRYHSMVNDQQKAMIEQAKMSALGIMACGVAHEINNPLTVIKTKTFLLKEKCGAGTNDTTGEYISNACDVISQTADRIGRIVKSLKSLSQNEDAVETQTVPVSLLVEEAITLSQIRSVHQGVTLKFDLAAFQKILIRVNPVQFGQVLLNLINNAYDAVAELEEKWVEIKGEIINEKIKIKISDSGPGLSVAAVANLFQPFFTTKEVGVGTGLGLSLSRRMIEKQHGTLEYLPEETNTTFLITLPKAE